MEVSYSPLKLLPNHVSYRCRYRKGGGGATPTYFLLAKIDILALKIRAEILLLVCHPFIQFAANVNIYISRYFSNGREHYVNPGKQNLHINSLLSEGVSRHPICFL